MDRNELRRLFEYSGWANQETLAGCAQLSPEQFRRDLKSSFPSVRDTLVHILGGELIWLGRLHGRPPAGFPNPADFADCEAVRKSFAETDAGLIHYIANLPADRLNAEIHYKTMAGTPFTGMPAPMLQHLANHGTYHRGQVATMLRQLGAQAVSTDMIRYHRELAAKASA
jgi:uncharacterized damage-inducible protein DinB